MIRSKSVEKKILTYGSAIKNTLKCPAKCYFVYMFSAKKPCKSVFEIALGPLQLCIILRHYLKDF